MASPHATRACTKRILIRTDGLFHFSNFSLFLGFCGDSCAFCHAKYNGGSCFPPKRRFDIIQKPFLQPRICSGIPRVSGPRCAVNQYREDANRIHKHLFEGRSITGECMSCYINRVWGVGLRGIHSGYLRHSLLLLWASSQRASGCRTSSHVNFENI